MATKQHYVPNFILSNFASADGTLWVVRKDTGRCWAKRAGRGGRYDAFAENEYLPQEVDDALWPGEDVAAPIMSSILATARTGDVPDLDRADKEHLCRFLLMQILRVPRVKDYAAALDAAAYYAMLCDDPGGEQDNDHPERNLFRRMVGMELEVALVSPDSPSPLLVGDEPCLLARDKVVMRLAQDVCLQLSRPADFAGGFHTLGPDYVAKLNRETFVKAKRFVASPHREVMLKLVRLCS